MPRSVYRRSRSVIVAAVVSAVSVAAALPAAATIPAEPGPPPVQPMQPTVTAVNSTMWQTNNAVWSVATKNGVVYAGGDFTKVRAPGTAVGDPSETNAFSLTAFNAGDGTPVKYPYGTAGKTTLFNHTVNGRVYAIAIS